MIDAPKLPRLVLLVASALVVGCASLHPGSYAKPIGPDGRPSPSLSSGTGLVISGREVTDLSSPYFGFVQVTFENTSAQWIRVHRMNLDFGHPARNESVFIPWGSDIQSWSDAIYQRHMIRETNTQTALAFVALGGAVANVAAPRKPLGAIGGIVAIGSLATLAARQHDARVQGVESTAPFPDSHLLALPFGVPPGLFAKKWIVFNTTNRSDVGCIRSMVLDYEVEGGRQERVMLEFKPALTRSEWQSNVCGGAS